MARHDFFNKGNDRRQYVVVPIKLIMVLIVSRISQCYRNYRIFEDKDKRIIQLEIKHRTRLCLDTLSASLISFGLDKLCLQIKGIFLRSLSWIVL
jgi:hypothetical protein